MPQRRLTILQVLPALESGGTERGVLEIAEASVAAGHRSLVISAGGQMVTELTGSGSTHIKKAIGTKSPLTLRHVPWLRRFMLDESVNVVDIHSRMPGWIAYLAWKSLPVTRRPALVSTVHGLHSAGFYSSIMCRGEHVIVVSEAVREYVRRNYRFVPEDRMHVIHRGIHSVEFPRDFQADEAWKSTFFQQFPETVNKPLLTLIGRITRLKGHKDLLRMMAGLRDRGIAAHALIVGGTDPRKASYADEVTAHAESMQLTGQVTFTGHRSDLKQIYAVSSIVLSLSAKPESFGRTVAEALSIGTPVVGYNHGGVAEILATQFPDGAVEAGNVDALTDRVASLLSQQLRSVPGPNVFEKSVMQQKTLELYETASQRENLC